MTSDTKTLLIGKIMSKEGLSLDNAHLITIAYSPLQDVG